MSAAIARSPLAALLLAGVAATLLVAGCVASGGYGYDAGGLGVGYYEPYGVDYGGWDGGYRVGPVHRGGFHGDGFRGDRGGGDRGGGRNGPHAYRPAPPSRPMPSIPSHGRPGGRGGGAPRH